MITRLERQNLHYQTDIQVRIRATFEYTGEGQINYKTCMHYVTTWYTRDPRLTLWNPLLVMIDFLGFNCITRA
jgi:hypothetical protein